MRILFILLFQLTWSIGIAQSAFQIVPLGVKGGIQEGNLSCYMIAPAGSNRYVTFDAGSLNSGIRKAIDNKVFDISADSVLKSYIKGYFISHAHLDHISGLVINSTDDSPKNIYSFPKCLEMIKNHYFNWESWPNFGNEGAGFALKKYKYKTLEEGEEIKIEGTEMFVKSFKLSHSNPYEGAAFLMRSDSSYVLYFGDTGPDEIEKTDKMRHVWTYVAPLLKSGKLKGIFLEVSYPDEQADGKLYGHLTPKWFFKEMDNLSDLAGKQNMKGLKVIVTHLKPGGGSEDKIKMQLEAKNNLQIKLIVPEQGVKIDL